MIIRKLAMSNFGPYEGENVFNIATTEKKNIVIIGGKNGAGKTTLFTALQVCLYGSLCMGNRVNHKNYVTFLKDTINKSAKLIKQKEFFVEVELSLHSNQALDNYKIKRAWDVEDNFKEILTVEKNGTVLNSVEVLDFYNYFSSLMPLEIFDMFFFDGESVIDSFFVKKGTKRLKESFCKLCGFDTFEIMKNNFKRLSRSENTSRSMEDYIDAQEKLQNVKYEYDEYCERVLELENEISDCEKEIKDNDVRFANKGGITTEEIAKKLFEIKEEERKREVCNSNLRKWANEVMPFVIIKDKMRELHLQVKKEDKLNDYKGAVAVLKNNDIRRMVSDDDTIDKIVSIIENEYSKHGKRQILGLSLEESRQILSQIEVVKKFDVKEFARNQNEIQYSLKRTEIIRSYIENNSTDGEKEYVSLRSFLHSKQIDLTDKLFELKKKRDDVNTTLLEAENSFERAKSKFEQEIKNNSIKDISNKSIMMLESIQNVLYKRKIVDIRDTVKRMLGKLFRKGKFIDDITIDSDFNIRLFRNENIRLEYLVDILSKDPTGKIIGTLGMQILQNSYGDNISEKLKNIKNEKETIIIPVEFDQNILSSGEKQIFLMILYFALVKISKYTMPFVIDTPFARIDSEHRMNIVKNFFGQLSGQIIILSTDEEIQRVHVNELNNKISKIILLENINGFTIVKENDYFGGKNVF